MKKINFFVAILPFLTIFNGIDISIGDFNTRIDHVWVIILAIFISINKKPIIFDLTLKLFFGFFLVSITSSLLNSPFIEFSILQTMNYCSVFLTYYVIINSIDSEEKFAVFIKYFVMCGLLAIVYGIILFGYSFVFGQVIGVNLDTKSAFGVYGTMREPNIYGSYSVIIFTIIFNRFLYRKLNKNQNYQSSIFFLFIASMGVLLSFTRSAWLAFMLVTIIGVLISVIKFRLSANYFRFIIFSFPIIFLTILILSNNSINNFLTYKFVNLFNTQSDTAFGRIILWQTALDSFQFHPLIGNGTYSFAALGVSGMLSKSTNAWIGNLYIRLLHDAGVIGAVLFLSGFLFVIRNGIINFTKLSKKLNSKQSSEILGLLLAITTILITFTFTDATVYCYGYIPLALLSAKINIISKGST